MTVKDARSYEVILGAEELETRPAVRNIAADIYWPAIVAVAWVAWEGNDEVAARFHPEYRRHRTDWRIVGGLTSTGGTTERVFERRMVGGVHQAFGTPHRGQAQPSWYPPPSITIRMVIQWQSSGSESVLGYDGRNEVGPIYVTGDVEPWFAELPPAAHSFAEALDLLIDRRERLLKTRRPIENGYRSVAPVEWPGAELDSFDILQDDLRSAFRTISRPAGRRPKKDKAPTPSQSRAELITLCSAWLLDLMLKTPDAPSSQEELFLKARQAWPSLTRRAFNVAWAAAIDLGGPEKLAAWTNLHVRQ